MAFPATADVVVIGGGINGGAVAYHLARQGVSNVVVLEVATLAHGASSRGAGIIRAYYAHPAEARLALESLDTYRNWGDEAGGDCGYRPTGFLWIVGPEGVRELKKTVAAQRLLGAESEVSAPRDVAYLQPHVNIEDLGGAAYERLGGYGTPATSTAAQHAAALRFGARLHEGVGATRPVAQTGHITGVETTAGRISAPTIVLAAGAWSAPLATSVGVTTPLVPTRMTTGTIRRAPFTNEAMTFIDTVSDVFYRPTMDANIAHISVRDRRHNTVLDMSSASLREAVDGSASQDGITRLRQRMPSLDGQPMRAWVGLDGVTPDRRAKVGNVAEIDGLVPCVGGNYKGFKVAPAVGQRLAQLITTGQSTDLTSFNLDRFGTDVDAHQPPDFSLSGVG